MSCQYHFSTCYDNDCPTHMDEKTIVGWFPREPVITEVEECGNRRLPKVVRGIGWKTVFRFDDKDENVFWAVDLERVRTRKVEDRYWKEIGWTKMFFDGVSEDCDGSPIEEDRCSSWDKADDEMGDLGWS